MIRNNTSWRKLILLVPILLGCLVLCQCEKKRTVKSTRSGGYKFGGGEGGSGGQSEGAKRIANTLKNEKTIKNSDGEVIRTEKRKDLYSDRNSSTVRDSGRSFDVKKQSKFSDRSVSKKEFKTPEYLKREEYAGNKTFFDGNREARESNKDRTSQFSKKLFNTKSSDSSTRATFRDSDTKSRFSNKRFETSTNRLGTKAQSNAAIPDPVKGLKGYNDNFNMSVDDVKKLVSPSSIR